MSSLWPQDSSENGNLGGVRMNGEGTGIGAPTPAVAGCLGKVSYAQFSPSVTCAKLRSNLDLYCMENYRIDPPPQTRTKNKTRKICVKGEGILIKALKLYTNCVMGLVFCVLWSHRDFSCFVCVFTV